MRNNKIGVNVHYIPTYRFSFYQEHVPTVYSDYPITEEVFKNIITLPIYPAMSENDIRTITEAIQEYKGIK